MDLTQAQKNVKDSKSILSKWKRLQMQLRMTLIKIKELSEKVRD